MELQTDKKIRQQTQISYSYSNAPYRIAKIPKNYQPKKADTESSHLVVLAYERNWLANVEVSSYGRTGNTNRYKVSTAPWIHFQHSTWKQHSQISEHELQIRRPNDIRPLPRITVSFRVTTMVIWPATVIPIAIVYRTRPYSGVWSMRTECTPFTTAPRYRVCIPDTICKEQT